MRWASIGAIKFAILILSFISNTFAESSKESRQKEVHCAQVTRLISGIAKSTGIDLGQKQTKPQTSNRAIFVGSFESDRQLATQDFLAGRLRLLSNELNSGGAKNIKIRHIANLEDLKGEPKLARLHPSIEWLLKSRLTRIAAVGASVYFAKDVSMFYMGGINMAIPMALMLSPGTIFMPLLIHDVLVAGFGPSEMRPYLENWWNRGEDYSGNWMFLSRKQSPTTRGDYIFGYEPETRRPQLFYLETEVPRSRTQRAFDSVLNILGKKVGPDIRANTRRGLSAAMGGLRYASDLATRPFQIGYQTIKAPFQEKDSEKGFQEITQFEFMKSENIDFDRTVFVVPVSEKETDILIASRHDFDNTKSTPIFEDSTDSMDPIDVRGQLHLFESIGPTSEFRRVRVFRFSANELNPLADSDFNVSERTRLYQTWGSVDVPQPMGMSHVKYRGYFAVLPVSMQVSDLEVMHRKGRNFEEFNPQALTPLKLKVSTP